MPDFDCLTDFEVGALAMACRAAARQAEDRRVEARRNRRPIHEAVTPAQFMELAERLESCTANRAHARRGAVRSP